MGRGVGEISIPSGGGTKEHEVMVGMTMNLRERQGKELDRRLMVDPNH